MLAAAAGVSHTVALEAAAAVAVAARVAGVSSMPHIVSLRLLPLSYSGMELVRHYAAL